MPKGTTRGVFVVDKQGKVLASQAGGPEATVGVVQALVEGGLGAAGGAEGEEVKEKVEEEVKEAKAANGEGKKSEEEEEEAKGEAAE